jgi:two-component system phosphate regulon sensor histidine kinase PhoR
VLPEGLGLLHVAVVLVALGAGFFFTDYAVRQLTWTAQQHETEALAQVLASGLGALPPDDETAATALVDNLGRTPQLRAVRWVAPDGTPRLVWPSAGTAHGAAPVPAVKRADQTTRLKATAEVRRLSGEPAGQLQLERTVPVPAGLWVALLWPWSLTGVITLLVFVGFCRGLRRHLRPVAAIERTLRTCADGLEKELLTLTLSDSLGAAARGWNRVVEQLGETQRLLSDSAARRSGNEVLARYENTVFRTLVDRLPFGVLRVGPEQLIGYANVSAAALLGRLANDLVGQQISALVDNGAVLQALATVQARPRGELVVDHSRKDGEHEFTLRFRIMPAAESAGAGDVLVTIEDISQLREGQRARDNFLYHVTHELRTPLTNIHAYAETLTKPGFDDEQTRKECYNVLISETERLSRLVEDILSISQLEVGTARFEPGAVDLARLVRQMVQDNLGAADGKKIDLTLALPPKVPKMRGDKQRLCVLLNNLIGNAIKYTPAAGKVQVTLEVRDQRVQIAVSDTGIGIAPKDQPHVFDKFYRAADEAVQAVPGTGLGLALAHEVARLHGGEIFLKSELGRGSTFTVELPLAAAETEVVAP